MASKPFKPALIVVDFQEDFCPPHGSLAVREGRDIAPTINALLSLPFTLKIATQDWHPADHVSFAANHADAAAFTSFATIRNPENPDEAYESRLWPVHCVQDSPGAALVPELDVALVDAVVRKGTHPAVEMYSAFYPPLSRPRIADSGLAAQLRAAHVSHCFVVGLAADYCVKATALDAAREGFVTVIVEEGTRAVDPAAWQEEREAVVAQGVGLVSMTGPELQRVRERA